MWHNHKGTFDELDLLHLHIYDETYLEKNVIFFN